VDRLRARLEGREADRLTRTALAWQVGALLGYHLSAAERRGERVPAAGAPLVREYRNTQATGLLLLAEARRLLAGLTKRIGKVCLLKGVDLLTRLYPDPGMRPMCDCDVLVRPDAFDTAQRYLATLGAERLHSAGELDDRFSAWQLLLPGREAISIDLHRALLQPEYCPLDHDALWARSEACELDGLPLRRLATEDALVFSCLHSAKHGFGSLVHVVDVAELARCLPDRERLVARAGSWRARTATWAGLWLAGRLLGSPLEDRLAPGPAGRAALRLLLAGRLPAPLAAAPPRRLLRVARQVAVQDGVRARARYLGRYGLLWARARLGPGGAG